MNWDTVRSNWKTLKDRLLERWGVLSDAEIARRRAAYTDTIHTLYGITVDADAPPTCFRQFSAAQSKQQRDPRAPDLRSRASGEATPANRPS